MHGVSQTLAKVGLPAVLTIKDEIEIELELATGYLN